MHIVIKDPGNYSEKFEMDEKPHESQVLRLRKKDNYTQDKFFRIILVANTPLGLRGVFSYQVSLVEIPDREVSQVMRQLFPLVVEEYNT